MTTQTAGNFLLEIKRLIKAPWARVYAAWTDLAHLNNGSDPKRSRRAPRRRISLGPDEFGDDYARRVPRVGAAQVARFAAIWR
jgi:hypothetical protein